MLDSQLFNIRAYSFRPNCTVSNVEGARAGTGRGFEKDAYAYLTVLSRV